jgi:hypothetical protein
MSPITATQEKFKVNIGGREVEVDMDAPFKATIQRLVSEEGWNYARLYIDGEEHDDFPGDVQTFRDVESVRLEKYTKVGC